VPVTGAFALAAALLMWPVLRAPHHRVFGEPSDPLGEVWRLQQFRTGEIDLVGDPVAHTANAPDGVPIRRALDVAQVLYDVPAAGVARLIPAVPAYNLLVWVALWTSGLAAAWALHRLGVRWSGALAAGALFMVAPVHMVEVRLHVAIALVAPLPVLLAVGVAVARRPRVRTGAAFGALAAGCAYLNAYLPLAVAAVVLAVLAAAVGAAWAHPARRAPLLRAGAAAAGAGALVLVPLAIVLLAPGEAVDPSEARPADDLRAFALSPAQLVDRDLSSYLGLAGIALAVAGLVWGRGGRALRGALGVLTIAGAWLALSPAAPVVGALAPAEWIHSVFPYWRVYGRAAIAAALGVACLAGLAIARLAERPSAAARAAAAVLAAVALADVLRAPPPAAADLGRRDPVAAWLGEARGAVAEYPLRGFADYRFGPYLLRQVRHGRPLLNGGIAGTRAADLGEAAVGDGGRQAAAALRLAGADRAAVDAGTPVPPGLPATPLPGGARGLRVPPGPAAVALPRGGYPAEPGPDGTTFRWLGADGALRVIASCPGPVTVRLTAVSAGLPRRVRVGGRTFTVGTTPTSLAVPVDVPPGGARDLPLATAPAPAPLPGGDPRVAGIGVYGLSAAARCAARP